MATLIVADTHPQSGYPSGFAHQGYVDLCAPTLLTIPRLFHPHLGPPGRIGYPESNRACRTLR
jgi:hypothetical protein